MLYNNTFFIILVEYWYISGFFLNIDFYNFILNFYIFFSHWFIMYRELELILHVIVG